jgi:hypothetical protein
MRVRHPGRLVTAALLLATAVPVRAGGRSVVLTPRCAPVEAGVWTPVVAPANVDYGTSYRSFVERGGDRYEVTVDPWVRCRAYRIGTPEQRFADRNVVQVTGDGGLTWRPLARTGAAFGARHVYVPRPGTVYVAEDGDGTAVLRVDAACPEGCPANGGIEGEHLYSLAFSPLRPSTAYAVTLPCKAMARPEADPACTPVHATVTTFLGKVAVWKTVDGGAAWTRLAVPDADSARDEFALQVDPGNADAPYAYDLPDVPVAGGQTARLLVGETFRPTGTGVRTSARSFRVFRRHGRPVVLAHDETTGQDVVWEDAGRSLRRVGDLHGTEATPTLPLAGGRLFGLHVRKQGGGPEGHDARATWSDDLWSSVRVEPGRFPAWLPPDYAYELESAQAGADGTVYVTAARQCRTDGTYEGDVTRCPGAGYWHYEWVTWAYRVPPDGVAVAPPGDPTSGRPAPCAVGDCALVAGTACPLPDGAAGGAGIAYDGRDLLYPVDADTPRTVVLGRVDAATCAPASERTTIPLDAADLARAVALTRRTHRPGVGSPTLDPAYSDLDTLAYDPAARRLFFSLRDNDSAAAETRQGNPASLWSWDGDGAARLVYVGDRCLGDTGNTGGMDLLAWDGAGVVACGDARPLPVSASGVPRTPYCVMQGPFRGFGYGWPVTSWTAAEGHRALLLTDRGTGADLVPYDLAGCGAETSFGADALGAAKRPGAHTQLACTPPRDAGPTLLWQRTGGTATPYAIPAGGDWCRTATRTQVLTAPARTCVTVTVPGPLSGPRPVAGRSVRLRLDGVVLTAPPTDVRGTTCVARVARHDARASFAGDRRYLPSAGSWPPRRVPRVVPPRVTSPRLPRRPAAPPAARPADPAVPPAPRVPQPPLVPAVQVPAPPPPGANVGGLSETREEEQQLAYAGQDAARDETRQAVEELAAVAVLMAGAFAVAWRRRAAEAVAPARAWRS